MQSAKRLGLSQAHILGLGLHPPNWGIFNTLAVHSDASPVLLKDHERKGYDPVSAFVIVTHRAAIRVNRARFIWRQSRLDGQRGEARVIFSFGMRSRYVSQ